MSWRKDNTSSRMTGDSRMTRESTAGPDSQSGSTGCRTSLVTVAPPLMPSVVDAGEDATIAAPPVASSIQLRRRDSQPESVFATDGLHLLAHQVSHLFSFTPTSGLPTHSPAPCYPHPPAYACLCVGMCQDRRQCDDLFA